MMSLV